MQALQQSATWCKPISRQQGRQRASIVANVSSFDVQVRPYTLRKGDTLETIANKRSITTDQLISINPGVAKDKVAEGSTILIPANKLSPRDKEIVDGMGTTYRLYPVRSGETLSDIMSKRSISMDEMQALNPGIDLAKIKDNQVVKLPINKFTVREREMLIGSGIVPHEFFSAAKNPFVIGGMVLMLVCGFVMAWQRFHNDPDMQANE